MSDSYTFMPIHMTFSTLRREPSLPAELLPRLHAYLGGILRELKCDPLAIGGVQDHVHILFDLHPSRAVADVARVVKANSSKWLHETLSLKDVAWQRGYAAFAVSPSAADDVRRYIANQAEHHRTRTFRDELVEFLNRAGIEFEQRYLE